MCETAGETIPRRSLSSDVGASARDALMLPRELRMRHQRAACSWNVCRLLAISVCFGVCGIFQAKVEAESVAILLTSHDAYRSAAAAAEKALTEKGHQVKLYELPRQASVATSPSSSPSAEDSALDPELADLMERVAGTKPAVIVTMGERATLMTLARIGEVPVVYSMVTNAPDFVLTQPDHPLHSWVAGVTTDIQPKTQLEWIAKVQPQARTIGVLHSERSQQTAEAIRRTGDGLGLKVVLIETSKDDFAKGIEELTRRGCDGLLMISDAQVYTRETVKPTLLWGLRQKKSVWTFSSNLVKSGALGSLYADYSSIGRQTADIALRVIETGKASKIGLEYPKEVKKAINERTASMIGLSIPTLVLNETQSLYGKE